jgi:TolA-binding protein
MLRAGQRLAVNLPKKEILITELEEDAWPVAPAAAPPTAADTGAARRPAASAPGTPSPASAVAARSSGRRTWAEALAAGDWDQILDEVDRAGVKRTLAEASSEELFVLADAARYRRRVGLARAALLAERRRFPDSARALDAVFLLGRMDESNERPTRKAVAWYEEYLTRAPTGTYASEALGRKMIATSKLTGAPAARPIAEEYLRRFPGGTYAGAARALLRAP